MHRLVSLILIHLFLFSAFVAVWERLASHSPQPELQRPAPAAERKIPSFEGKDSGRLQPVAVLPVGGRGGFRIRFLTALEGWVADDGKVWRTQDGGKNWSLILVTGTHNRWGPDRISQVEFTDRKTGWVIESDRMYKTDDGGDNWHSFHLPFMGEDGYLYVFKFLKGGEHGWVAGGRYRPLKDGEEPPPSTTVADSCKSL